MIKHIVLFNVKSENKDKNKIKIVKELESLSVKIKELVFLEIGTNFSERKSAYDIILLSHFKTITDLDSYKNHPEHIKVVQKIMPYIEKSAVCDYEIN